MTGIFLLLVVVLLSGLAYVNFAGSNPARWHQTITVQGDAIMEGGAVITLPYSAENLQKLVETMKNLPRSKRIAGSVEDEHLTFVTRTKWIGFPDYTTIERQGAQIKIFARLRFGKKDFGVNAARLAHLKQALD